MPRPERTVKVVRVIDGDSVVVEDLNSSHRYNVRLHAIDAPEYGQPCGSEAISFLTRLALNRIFTLEVTTRSDRYGRVVGILYESDRHQSLNHRMVAAGLAYSYTSYGTLVGVSAAEREARLKRLGIWRDGDGSIRPWTYRGVPVPPSRPVISRTDPGAARTPAARSTPKRRRRNQRDDGCIVPIVGILLLFILMGLIASIEMCKEWVASMG